MDDVFNNLSLESSVIFIINEDDALGKCGVLQVNSRKPVIEIKTDEELCHLAVSRYGETSQTAPFQLESIVFFKSNKEWCPIQAHPLNEHCIFDDRIIGGNSIRNIFLLQPIELKFDLTVPAGRNRDLTHVGNGHILEQIDDKGTRKIEFKLRRFQSCHSFDLTRNDRL